MLFAYSYCNGSAHVAVAEYQRRFPDRRAPCHGVFPRVLQTLRESGSLSSRHVTSGGEASLAVELPEEGTTASSTQGEAVPSTSLHQTAITEYIPKKMGLIQKKKVDSKLMGLFTKDYQPFSIVNDSGFRNFVHALNPAYEIPSRRTTTNVMLTAAYAEANEKVQQKLQGIKTICLTTDCWTSASNESYMAVTGHFIN
ncbi:uncharacterized protein LOC124595778 isoform X1 [Schistocerca americana]|uniref:uncharacterized protein LOC124595778 isoform X1 n=1 Tax=Schistocerca americana TaxID=7009 RepID=UPI001F4FB82C|nr:uncharacterized protein LOC124595778 isoform X1 [Schistocerca americana]